MSKLIAPKPLVSKLPKNQPILVAKSISKVVETIDGKLTLLQNIHFKLNAGHSLAIIGSSGSGKSTLLGILAGLDLPTSGQVFLMGENITQLTEEERTLMRLQSIGFVFQSFQLLETLTALENVMLPLELKGNDQAKTEAIHLLTQVGLKERLAHYPKQLSGGEQQRVAIARAFAAKPKILFADEPTGNLDQTTGAQIIELLFELNQKLDTTLVLVTHELRLAARCQHRLQLENGQIVQEDLKDD